MKRNNDYLEILLKQCDEIKEILNSGKKASCASVCYGEICQRLTKDFLPPVEREDIASISYALLETCRRCSEYALTNNKTNENIQYTNCIKIVEETKDRLKKNSNYDMTIDNLLLKIWEEING